MGIDILPKELLNNPEVKKVMGELEDVFYKMFEDAGKTMSSAVPKDYIDSSGIMSVIFRTMAVNVCKTAFDKAYVRYVSGGVMND
jgi:hypothetical protein